MTQNMTVAICGLGERVAHVARTLFHHDRRLQLVGYCDPRDMPNGVAILHEAGIKAGNRYSELNELLASEKPDLLMVGSPNNLHLEHIREGLEAGARVLSEKPLVTTAEDTFTLLQLLKKHGRDRLMVGLVLRYSPLFRGFRSLQHEGVLGTIVSMEGSEHLAPPHGAFLMRDWRRHESTSGGYMLEKCCHDLDLYQGVMGCRPTRVASFGGRRVFVPDNSDLEASPIYGSWHGKWDRSLSAFTGDGDIVDHQTAIIEYANGASLTFHTNTHAANKTRRICALGTRGMIEGDFERNSLRAFDAQSKAMLADHSYEYDATNGHYGAEELMVADLCAHLFEAAPLPVTALDALEAGLTAIKLDEARKQGIVVDLAESWARFDTALNG